jgi:membrane protein implicated in regulation of membrane protease activity
MFGFLLYWYNIPFIVALGCCVVLGLLQIVGGFGDTDVDADVGVDIDADVDIDAHVDADIGAHAAQVVPGEVAKGGPFASVLTAFGLGQTPLLLVLMVLLGSFSIIGLLANTMLVNIVGSYPSFWFFAILLLSFVLALWLTSRFGRMFNRISPNSSTAISFEQLVGRVGIVVSTQVSSTYGRVQVKDRFGSLHTVFAVIESGPHLPERSEVALVAYDAARRQFVVRGLDEASKTS